MELDVRTVKVNMIVNFVRDYLTIKETSSVSVIYCKRKLYVSMSNGMCGSDMEIDIGGILLGEIETSMHMLIQEIESHLDR